MIRIEHYVLYAKIFSTVDENLWSKEGKEYLEVHFWNKEDNNYLEVQFWNKEGKEYLGS